VGKRRRAAARVGGGDTIHGTATEAHPEERTMEKGAAKSTEKLSEAIDQYKASLATGKKITGKVTEEGNKLWVICKSESGSPVCAEFKRGDVIDVQQRSDADTATVSVKENADYTLTIAGVVGREDDLPRGLRDIFTESAAGGARRS
jgi:hypothetical protein